MAHKKDYHRATDMRLQAREHKQWRRQAAPNDETSEGSSWRNCLTPAALRFHGSDSHHDRRWLQRLAELRKYKEEHGDCLVPAKYTANRPLGDWVDKQRQMQRKGELQGWREMTLDEVGFCWDPYEEAWTDRYEELRSYWRDHGHCLVPSSHGELGIWVSNQRTRRASLSPDRTARLDSLDFVWDVLEAQWEERFQQLAEFKKAHGHCLVPRSHGGLVLWVGNQRQRYRSGDLLLERQQRLESLGFEF